MANNSRFATAHDPILRKKLQECFTYSEGVQSAPITSATTNWITGWEENYPSSGGYVCDLSGNYTHLQTQRLLQDLHNHQWIDDGTRG